MYTHFEDWSSPIFLKQLADSGLPHTDKIIKVFASDLDPRVELELPDLTVVEMDESKFPADITYPYAERGSYSGEDLEKLLVSFNLGNTGTCSIRALFRFANQHGFCQAAMAATAETDWLIDHPFGDIDGIEAAQRQPERETGIHLDIFFPESLIVLKDVVDYSNPKAVLTMKEGHRWRKTFSLPRE